MATRLPFSGEQWWNATDKQAFIGAKMYTYDAGTTTNRPTYTTAAATVQHSNPVIADDQGIFPEIYGSGSFFISIMNSTDTKLIYQADNINQVTGVPTYDLIIATGTYNTPAGVTFMKVTCVAGGGSGASSNETGGFIGGGGGSGGESWVIISNPDSSYSVTIGAGGAFSATQANDGNAGGNTLFGTVCRANGGSEGKAIGHGGLGGILTSAIGDVKLPGFAGGPGSIVNVNAGGPTTGIGGTGGGSGGSPNAASVSANSGGGSYGGAFTTGGSWNPGGVAADGYIRVEYYT